jgi:hypothetical protein
VAPAKAISSIQSRFNRTRKAEINGQPMGLLFDNMIHKYQPMDILVLVMSQPASFTISPQHLVSFPILQLPHIKKIFFFFFNKHFFFAEDYFGRFIPTRHSRRFIIFLFSWIKIYATSAYFWMVFHLDNNLDSDSKIFLFN